MKDSLSPAEARKLVLLSQQLPASRSSGSVVAATLSAIEHLGYIQIDTISAVQRAHHHTLWNRNTRYEPSHLDTLVASKQVFEYWAHAAAYLPMRDYRFSLVRKKAFASGELKHWYMRDKRLMQWVLKRIANEGPLMAKDFDGAGKKSGEWSVKPAKRALECLYMQGELMVPERVNFHKVYDLTERVLPAGLDTSVPSSDEYARFLIASYLRANGLGQATEIAYLLQNTKPLVTSVAEGMVEAGALVPLNVSGRRYYALPESLSLLSNSLRRSKLSILSPFDNLLIQRTRMRDLFDFDYQIECYVPAGKRQYGYFSLPILWDGRLVARMDCTADRKAALLNIHHLALEHWLQKKDAFRAALEKSLEGFMAFNGCTRYTLHKTTGL